MWGLQQQNHIRGETEVFHIYSMSLNEIPGIFFILYARSLTHVPFLHGLYVTLAVYSDLCLQVTSVMINLVALLVYLHSTER
jgi:hypothetical protein